MITHKPQLWFPLANPLTQFMTYFCKTHSLLNKLNLWYMFVNALLHKTQLRYTFSEPYLLTNPIMEYFFAKLPLLTKPNYHILQRNFTDKSPIMLPYTWKWNPSLTKTQLWLEFSQGPFITVTKPNSCILFALAITDTNPIMISFCQSPFIHTSTPNNCFCKAWHSRDFITTNQRLKDPLRVKEIAFMCLRVQTLRQNKGVNWLKLQQIYSFNARLPPLLLWVPSSPLPIAITLAIIHNENLFFGLALNPKP